MPTDFSVSLKIYFSLTHIFPRRFYIGDYNYRGQWIYLPFYTWWYGQLSVLLLWPSQRGRRRKFQKNSIVINGKIFWKKNMRNSKYFPKCSCYFVIWKEIKKVNFVEEERYELFSISHKNGLWLISGLIWICFVAGSLYFGLRVYSIL